ncbi:hypothetical protein [Nocardioides sp.]|uniref:hypothetical protein n=1 Tax=Nocardioides sp. TaxID=35761 RepID=UPI003569B83E
MTTLPVTLAQPVGEVYDTADADALAKLEAIRALVAGEIAVTDGTAQTTLAAIQSALAGTLTVDTGLTTQTDGLTNAQLRDSALGISDTTDTEATHVVATVSTSGDTTVHTPAAGKAIRLRWIYSINDPTATSAPLIKVSLGGTEVYRAWALSKRQVVTGPVDGALVVNLSAAGNVAVTAILEEI